MQDGTTITGHCIDDHHTTVDVDHDGVPSANRSVAPFCLEGAIAVAEQHRDTEITNVGHRQVGHSIAIEVAHGHGIGNYPSPGVLCRLERPIAVAEQHGDTLGITVGHGHVRLAIAIEV